MIVVKVLIFETLYFCQYPASGRHDDPYFKSSVKSSHIGTSPESFPFQLTKTRKYNSKVWYLSRLRLSLLQIIFVNQVKRPGAGLVVLDSH